MAREIRGTDPQTVVARDYRSLAQLHDLAALAGSRASAAGAVLTPRADPTSRHRPRRRRLHAAQPGHPGALARGRYRAAPSTSTRRPAATRSSPAAASTSWPAASRCGPRKDRFGCSRAARAGRAASTTASRATAGSPSPTAIPAGRSPTRAGRWRSAAPTYSSSDIRSVNGVSYWKIIKGMIVTDNVAWKFYGMSTGCYEEIVAHELGHAIGFGHASDRPALMYPAITPDCWGRSHVDSAVGRRAGRHGGAVSPRRHRRPAAEHPDRAGRGGHRLHGDDHLDARRRAARRRRATSSSPAPRPAGPTSARPACPGRRWWCPACPTGIYYIRVVARSSSGASAPTPDYMVNAGVTAPAAPGNVMGSTAPAGTS